MKRDKVLVNIDGVVSVTKKPNYPFPLFEIAISRNFLVETMEAFKKNRIPGDTIIMNVVGKIE